MFYSGCLCGVLFVLFFCYFIFIFILVKEVFIMVWVSLMLGCVGVGEGELIVKCKLVVKYGIIKN